MWLIVLVVILLIIVAPVMIAARIVGARRTGFWMCLLALIVSFAIVSCAVRLFHAGGLVSFFAAPLGFMMILDTTYLRGLGIVVLQYLITAIVVAILLFTALGSMLHMKEIIRDNPINSAPAESV
jgi:hypothetical protein